MKILLLDIETAPNLVHVWGLWNQNISLPQIIDSGYVLCWSAKWYGEDTITYDSIYHSSKEHMLQTIYELLDEADVVIHYNGTKFDIPTLNKEFVEEGLLPPSPFKQIDLLTTARKQFRFPSNKLDYIAQALKIGKKTKHRGHNLWIDCMNMNKSAWEEMIEYNINDVALLEGVYERLKPWIKNHPNRFLYTEKAGCPTCGAENIQKRGFAYTTVGRYQRFCCKDCGSWFRSFKNLNTTREYQKYG
jgi:hypothetical protein